MNRSHCPWVILELGDEEGLQRDAFDRLLVVIGGRVHVRRAQGILRVGPHRAHAERTPGDQHEDDPGAFREDEVPALVATRDFSGLQVAELPEVGPRVRPDGDQPELGLELEASILGTLADRRDRRSPKRSRVVDGPLLDGRGELESTD